MSKKCYNKTSFLLLSSIMKNKRQEYSIENRELKNLIYDAREVDILIRKKDAAYNNLCHTVNVLKDELIARDQYIRRLSANHVHYGVLEKIGSDINLFIDRIRYKARRILFRK